MSKKAKKKNRLAHNTKSTKKNSKKSKATLKKLPSMEISWNEPPYGQPLSPFDADWDVSDEELDQMLAEEKRELYEMMQQANNGLLPLFAFTDSKVLRSKKEPASFQHALSVDEKGYGEALDSIDVPSSAAGKAVKDAWEKLRGLVGETLTYPAGEVPEGYEEVDFTDPYRPYFDPLMIPMIDEIHVNKDMDIEFWSSEESKAYPVIDIRGAGNCLGIAFEFEEEDEDGYSFQRDNFMSYAMDYFQHADAAYCSKFDEWMKERLDARGMAGLARRMEKSACAPVSNLQYVVSGDGIPYNLVFDFAAGKCFAVDDDAVKASDGFEFRGWNAHDREEWHDDLFTAVEEDFSFYAYTLQEIKMLAAVKFLERCGTDEGLFDWSSYVFGKSDKDIKRFYDSVSNDKPEEFELCVVAAMPGSKTAEEMGESNCLMEKYFAFFLDVQDLLPVSDPFERSSCFLDEDEDMPNLEEVEKINDWESDRKAARRYFANGKVLTPRGEEDAVLFDISAFVDAVAPSRDEHGFVDIDAMLEYGEKVALSLADEHEFPIVFEYDGVRVAHRDDYPYEEDECCW